MNVKSLSLAIVLMLGILSSFSVSAQSFSFGFGFSDRNSSISFGISDHSYGHHHGRHRNYYPIQRGCPRYGHGRNYCGPGGLSISYGVNYRGRVYHEIHPQRCEIVEYWAVDQYGNTYLATGRKCY